jgi:hypothetical protein
MRLIIKQGADRRRENLPTISKVIILIPDKVDNTGPRDLVLAARQPSNNN